MIFFMQAQSGASVCSVQVLTRTNRLPHGAVISLQPPKVMGTFLFLLYFELLLQ